MWVADYVPHRHGTKKQKIALGADKPMAVTFV
jgi:hypothetical protein